MQVIGDEIDIGIKTEYTEWERRTRVLYFKIPGHEMYLLRKEED